MPKVDAERPNEGADECGAERMRNRRAWRNEMRDGSYDKKADRKNGHTHPKREEWNCRKKTADRECHRLTRAQADKPADNRAANATGDYARQESNCGEF